MTPNLATFKSALVRLFDALFVSHNKATFVGKNRVIISDQHDPNIRLGALSNTSIVYIDEEGSEVPLDSECKFQEALRLAKLNKTSLKLIFYCAEPKLSDMIYFDQYNCGSNPSGKHARLVRQSMTCHENVAPEWFTDYMKKFKKELLQEMKFYINDVVRIAVAKEKDKSDKHHTAALVCLPDRKKKKASERDVTDLTEQRQLRLQKKLSPKKQKPLAQVYREAIDLFQGTLQILESNHRPKSKSARIGFSMSEGKNLLNKSASFAENNTCLSFPLGSDFTVAVQVINDGKVQWSVPYLECFEYEGLFPNEFRITLPNLLPKESCFTSLGGKLSNKTGIHYLKCKVVDGLERVGPVFTCWIRVSDPVKSPENYRSDSAGVKESNATDSGLGVGTLMDLEKDLITSSRKKIEENINEIERRLRDIDLLQPSTCTEQKSGNAEKTNEKADEVQTGCDSTPEVVDFDNASEVCISQLGKETEKNETAVASKKDRPLEHSDSDLSIILSEEEDNFLVVPSDGLSSAESVHEEKISPIAEPKQNEAKFNEEPVKPEIQNQSFQRQAERDEASTTAEDLHPSQASPTRSRWSLFGEDISKPKKMKSKSTEYCFKAANLTQPTFRRNEGRPSRFTFTGEKEAKPEKLTKHRFKGVNLPFGESPGFYDGKPFKFTFAGEKQKSSKSDVIPKTDALGRVIYAVNSTGCCIPVRDLSEQAEGSRSPKNSGQRTQTRQIYRPEDMPNGSTLPNALVNAASIAFNTASNAYNTAKYVINNLQSALVTEGKTEMGQPAYDDSVKRSESAMDRLCEMGYFNVELNRVLLLLHQNDISKVVNNLVDLQENAP